MMSLLAFMQRLPTSTPWPRQRLVGGDQLGAVNAADGSFCVGRSVCSGVVVITVDSFYRIGRST